MEKEIIQLKPDDEVLNPLLDPIFKALFTSDTEESRCALRDLISAYIDRPVKEAKVVSNEPTIEMAEDKQIRYDINCVFNDGEKCNVEMTIFPCASELIRLEYYVSRLFQGQKARGNRDWGKLKHSYQISIIAENNVIDDEEVIHLFEYYDKKNEVSLNGRTHIITVEMRKFHESEGTSVKKLTQQEKWIVFFKYVKEQGKRALVNDVLQEERGIRMAMQTLLSISKDEEMQMRAISEEKRLNDYEMDIATNRGAAFREGRAEGIEEGIEKGEKKLVRSMYENGLQLDQIADIAETTIEQVKNWLGL